MKFCYNTNFNLPKQSQRSRSVLQDGSRSLGLFWKAKTLSYNRRNTVPFREHAIFTLAIKRDFYTQNYSKHVIYKSVMCNLAIQFFIFQNNQEILICPAR